MCFMLFIKLYLFWTCEICLLLFDLIDHIYIYTYITNLKYGSNSLKYLTCLSNPNPFALSLSCWLFPSVSDLPVFPYVTCLFVSLSIRLEYPSVCLPANHMYLSICLHCHIILSICLFLYIIYRDLSLQGKCWTASVIPKRHALQFCHILHFAHIYGNYHRYRHNLNTVKKNTLFSYIYIYS